MNFYELVLLAIILPGIIFLFNKFVINKILEKKMKTIIFSTKNGKEEDVIVTFNSDEAEINKEIKKFIEFEDSVYKLIKNELSIYPNVNVLIGKYADFIIEYNDKRIAIECKSNLNHINKKSLERYFKDEGGVENLIFVSKNIVKNNIKNSIEKSYSNIDFIDNFDGSGKARDNLIDEIKKDLNIIYN
ncbi:hypothetical protein ABTP12_14785 [Acinetobacter baumannii]|nr:hypothetical protein [Acinetobacter baumannii]